MHGAPAALLYFTTLNNHLPYQRIVGRGLAPAAFYEFRYCNDRRGQAPTLRYHNGALNNNLAYQRIALNLCSDKTYIITAPHQKYGAVYLYPDQILGDQIVIVHNLGMVIKDQLLTQ